LADLSIFFALVVPLAAFFTLHVALSATLLSVRPRWRAPVAFVIPPLAPVFGFRAGKRKLSIAWLVLLGVYVIARIVAAIVG
jgi:hypothetical protein